MAETRITHNLAEVLDDFQVEIAKHNGRAVEAVRKIALGALNDVSAAPIDTGRYRASHVLTMEAPSTDTPPDHPDAGSNDPRYQSIADQNRQEAEATLAGLRDLRNVSVFIATNLEYANAIENGHSMQAPQGVYAVALKRAEARFRRIASGADF